MSGMRILIVGAGGTTGRLVAEGAVARGHSVTALVPSAGVVGDLAARVAVRVGDVLDAGVASDAVDGVEAVVVTLADARGGASEAARATLNLIRSMQRYGVRRLVVLSSGNVAPPGQEGQPGFFARLFDPGSRRKALAELRRIEISVRQSELDWTLVRAGRLSDEPSGGRGLRAAPGYTLPDARPLGRADLAAFLLDELERPDNVQHAVAVAG